jgi:predicted lipase
MHTISHIPSFESIHILLHSTNVRLCYCESQRWTFVQDQKVQTLTKEIPSSKIIALLPTNDEICFVIICGSPNEPIEVQVFK